MSHYLINGLICFPASAGGGEGGRGRGVGGGGRQWEFSCGRVGWGVGGSGLDVYNPMGGWGGNSVIIIFVISLNEIM